jgi:hypothetical protein
MTFLAKTVENPIKVAHEMQSNFDQAYLVVAISQIDGTKNFKILVPFTLNML